MTRLLPSDPDYPSGLGDLEDPPPIYFRGSIPTATAIAVVGTRACSRYGITIATTIGRRLAEVGWVTVSGLARGIDAAAHRGTVSAAGRGVAVLGSGLDRIYPRENAPLANALLSNGGAVISEYPGATPPDRWRFPARNRLIAALSTAVVVVEARVTGGAQITALLAAEMGRPVFAVPGDVDREASRGTNLLIRDGAIPIFGPDDLLEELALVAGPPPQPPGKGETGQLPDTGVDVEDLPELWSCTVSEALSRLGRLEAAGEVIRVGDRVTPKSRPRR